MEPPKVCQLNLHEVIITVYFFPSVTVIPRSFHSRSQLAPTPNIEILHNTEKIHLPQQCNGVKLIILIQLPTIFIIKTIHQWQVINLISYNKLDSVQREEFWTKENIIQTFNWLIIKCFNWLIPKPHFTCHTSVVTSETTLVCLYCKCIFVLPSVCVGGPTQSSEGKGHKHVRRCDFLSCKSTTEVWVKWSIIWVPEAFAHSFWREREGRRRGKGMWRRKRYQMWGYCGE